MHTLFGYAKRNLSIFPCAANKRPITSDGLYSATTDHNQIDQWFGGHPERLIGLRTGRGLFVIDLDIKPGIDGIENFASVCERHGGIPDTATVLTPSGGQHLYFWADGATIKNSVGKIAPGVDVRGDGGYVIAPPSAGYEWEASSDGIAVAPEWLVRLAARRDKEQQPKPAPDINADKAASALYACHYEGKSRDEWLYLGMSYKAAGGDFATFDAWSSAQPDYDEKHIKREWDSWDEVREGGPSLGPDYLYDRAQENGWNVHHIAEQPPIEGELIPPSKYRFARPSELIGRRPPAWRIKGVLPERGLAIIYGASGSGKTFFTLNMACALARGVPFFGARVKSCPVLYVAAEGAMQLRLEAYAHEEKLEPTALDGGVAVLESGVNLLKKDGGDVHELMLAMDACVAEQLHGEAPGLLILDTLNRVMPGGDENSSEDMGRIIEAASEIEKRFGCVVLFVHHSGKDDSKGSRGHSSLKAACDVEISIVRSGDMRTATVEKLRDGEDQTPIGTFGVRRVELGFVRDFDPEADPGERLASCVLEIEGTTKASKHAARPKNEDANVMLSLVHQCFAEKLSQSCPKVVRALEDGPKPGQLGTTLGQVWDKCDAHARFNRESPAATKKAKERALKYLIENDYLRRSDLGDGIQNDFVWLWTKGLGQ